MTPIDKDAKLRQEAEKYTRNSPPSIFPTTWDLLDALLVEFAKSQAAEEYHINSPEIEDFILGFKTEAAHQTERRGKEDEEHKPPHHYILVYNKLLGKLAVSIFDGDQEKFKHHLITLAAAGFNCHRQIQKPGTEINKWFNYKNQNDE